MRFEDVKLALQPLITDDLDALYGAYAEDAGTDDVEGFVRLLLEAGQIDQNTFDALAESGGTLATPIHASAASGTLAHPPQKQGGGLRNAGPTILSFDDEDDDVPAPAAPDAPPPGPAAEATEATAEATEATADATAPDAESTASENAQPAEPPAPTPPSKVGAPRGALRDAPTIMSFDDDDDPPTAPPQTETPAVAPDAAASADTNPADANPAGAEPLNDAADAADEAQGDGKEAEADDGYQSENVSGTFVLGEDGSNTGTGEDAPRRQRRRSTGAQTGAKLKATGETDTDARRRSSNRRQERKRANLGDRVIAGKGYEYLGLLGQGAMGAVNRMRDRDLTREVAFKTMSKDIADSPLASKFIGEAQITAQLQHPNIIPVYSLESTETGELAYSMKMVKGKTFEDLILGAHKLHDNKKPMDDAHSLLTRLEFFLKVCEAIHYAHLRGVVHRDLKPENLMIGPYNEVYVMDWGISKCMKNPPPEAKDVVVLEDEPEDDGDLIIGTPQYMSPEQANGLNDELDGASDQYALGLILYELVSLKQAVTGKAPLKIVMRQQDGDKNPLEHYAGEKIPPELAAIINKATAKAIKDRYPSVEALADDLQRYLRGEETIAKPDSAVQKVFRILMRHKELTALTVMGGAMMAAGLIIVILLWSGYQRAVQVAREERVTEVVTRVGEQAARIDGVFMRYEGLLGVVAATAGDMLTQGALVDSKVYWAEDYDLASAGDQDKGPPDLEKQPRYDMAVSFDYPNFFVPKGVSRDAVQVEVQRLEPMRRHYKRIHLRSKDEQSATRVGAQASRQLGILGVPLAWTHIGLESGLYAGYPGHGAYPDVYDPRKLPWYKLGTNAKIPTWGAPYPDAFELGRILPCAIGLYNQDGKFMGVASIELTFDYIIGELLEVKDIFNSKKDKDEKEDRVESFLVDNQGRIVVQSSLKDVKVRGGVGARELRLKDFPVDAVRDQISKRSSGYMEHGSDFVFYQRMNSIGWYYVLQGNRKTILDRTSE